MPVDIASLPSKILDHILRHVEEHDLLNVAFVCRRWNRLAMPILFTIDRNGAIYFAGETQAAGTCYLTLPKERRVLSLLRVAFSLTFIPLLVFEFAIPPNGAIEAYTFQDDLKQILDFLTGTKAQIKIPALSLVMMYGHPPGPSLNRERVCEELFKSCASCQELEVTDEYGDKRTYVRNPSTVHKKPRRTSTSFLGRLYSRKTRTKEHLNQTSFHLLFSPFRRMRSNTTPSPKTDYTLRTCTLDHHLNLLDGNLEQTLSGLETVHTLEVGSAQIWSAVWSQTLPKISAVTREVRELILDPTGKQPDDLVKFVSDLPQLTHLTICMPTVTAVSVLDNHQIEVPDLQPYLLRLTSISAPLAYIPALLTGSVPNLKIITINVRHDTRSLFTSTSERIFAAIVAQLARRKRNAPPELNLTINMAPPANLTQAETLSLDLEAYFQSGVGCEGPTPYAAILSLNVNGLDPLCPRIDPQSFDLVLVQWLKRFSNLRMVTFRDRMEPWDSHNRYPIYPLLHAVHGQCPSIRTVILGMTTYDVASTLATREDITASSKGSTLTLGDLNEDIFSIIFEYLEPGDLYALAKLTRNLRNWALPVYLSRRGHHTNDFVSLALMRDSTVPLEDLSALTLSPIQTIKHLHCYIEPALSLFLAFEFLHRLLRLLRKLTSVGQMTLLFGYGMDTPFTVPNQVSTEAKAVWTKLLLSVLNAMTEKATSVHVSGSGGFGKLTLSPLNFFPGKRQHLCLPTPPTKPKVETLSVHQDSLLLGVVNDWMTMTFEQNQTLKAFEASGLSHLAFPSLPSTVKSFTSLSELKLSGANILPEDILEVLQHLSGLQRLFIVGCDWQNEVMQFPPIVGQIPSFPFLQSLSAPSGYVNFFLSAPDTLPKLDDLVVFIPYLDPAFPDSITNILQSLCTTVEVLKTRPKKIYITLALWVPYYASAKAGEWQQLAKATTTLCLKVGDRSIFGNVSHTLLPWLTLFENLKVLDFADVQGFEVVNNGLSHATLKKACPSLDTLKLNGVVRDLATLGVREEYAPSHSAFP